MEKMVNQIVSADDCIDFSEEFVALAGVTFKKHFGPWKEGEKVKGLQWQWDECEVFETDEAGNKTGRSCKIQLTIA